MSPLDRPRTQRGDGPRRPPPLALALVLAGCTFDATGLGGDGPLGLATSATSSTATSVTDADTTLATAGPGTGSAGEVTGPADTTADTEEPTDPTAATTTGVDTSADPTGTTADTGGCRDPKPYYPDADADGYGAGDPVLACEEPPGHSDIPGDCNDAAAAAYPGAPEICDGLDDDCDGLIDEYSSANTGECGKCDLRPFAGRAYYFCDDATDWQAARDRCASVGGDLVVIAQAGEFNFIWGELQLRGGEFWIGADDRAVEGTYAWIDGTPLAVNDPNWAFGQPAGLLEDCATLGGAYLSQSPGEYRMEPCEPLIGRLRICEGPI